MATSEAANAPIFEDVTSKETETSPTVEEELSPTNQKYNETEGTILSDEENEKEFDDEDEKTEELSPLNQDPEPNVSFEDSGFTEFNGGEDKENIDNEEDDDN